ncbi:unnamed protein product [Lymnaea stagnalis]|uniref:Transmembrane protein 187 n=1 Tax=Lymnaea stagnalis TaxID=6523 RepID=A0AAV2I027_LYMST
MDIFFSSLFVVVTPFLGMYLLSATRMFDEVALEIGFQHYAEKPWLPLIGNFMPLNTLINFAYFGLGLYWCGMTRALNEQGILKNNDTAMFYIFNIMSCLYGCVQLLRILTQDVTWAVMDQWCTLPFFAILLVWGLYYKCGWSSKRGVLIINLSLLSYALSLCVDIGFEIALGLHVVCAIYGAVIAYRKHPAAESMRYFNLALLSCTGFVILKLLDHHMAHAFCIFKYMSGHFLSKICDVLQIHFVNNFFLDLTLQRAADLSIDEKNKFFANYEKQYQRSLSNDIMYEVIRRPKDKMLT